MKRFASALALFAVALLPACATTEHNSAAIHQGAVHYADVYYDGHYGPLYSGFWGPDRYFYYSTNGPVHRRDTARHVRRQASEGFRQVSVPDRMHSAHAASRNRQG